MKKVNCGMVDFEDQEEDFLFVVGEYYGSTLSSHQPGAQCEYGRINEQHVFALSTSE